jgi:hypothetical protein
MCGGTPRCAEPGATSIANIEETRMSAHHTATSASVGRNAALPSASPVGWIGATALLTAATLSLALVLPAPLVLPALSILFACVGFATAGGMYISGHRLKRHHHPAWEFAGLLVFLSFAAAILADVSEALAALEQLSTRAATQAPSS